MQGCGVSVRAVVFCVCVVAMNTHTMFHMAPEIDWFEQGIKYMGSEVKGLVGGRRGRQLSGQGLGEIRLL